MICLLDDQQRREEIFFNLGFSRWRDMPRPAQPQASMYSGTSAGAAAVGVAMLELMAELEAEAREGTPRSAPVSGAVSPAAAGFSPRGDGRIRSRLNHFFCQSTITTTWKRSCCRHAAPPPSSSASRDCGVG